MAIKCLNKCKRIQVIHIIFSEHNAIKLEIVTDDSWKIPKCKIWNLENTHLRMYEWMYICILKSSTWGYIEREKSGGRERRRGEKHPSVAFRTCPNWESNLQSLGVWATTPANWTTLPVLFKHFFFLLTWGTERDRDRDRHQFIPLFYTLIGWFLYVAWQDPTCNLAVQNYSNQLSYPGQGWKTYC